LAALRIDSFALPRSAGLQTNQTISSSEE